jgi:hypothetical protein
MRSASLLLGKVSEDGLDNTFFLLVIPVSQIHGIEILMLYPDSFLLSAFNQTFNYIFNSVAHKKFVFVFRFEIRTQSVSER